MSSSPSSDQSARPSPNMFQQTPAPRPDAPVLGTAWTRRAPTVGLVGGGARGKGGALAGGRRGGAGPAGPAAFPQANVCFILPGRTCPAPTLR